MSEEENGAGCISRRRVDEIQKEKCECPEKVEYGERCWVCDLAEWGKSWCDTARDVDEELGGHLCIHDIWSSIVDKMSETQPALASVFSHAACLYVGFGGLVIAFEKDAFFGKQAKSPLAFAGLLQACHAADWGFGPDQIIIAEAAPIVRAVA